MIGERSFNDSKNFVSQNSKGRGHNYNLRGRGRNSYNNRGRFQCQLCDKFDGLVNKYWFRFDKDFQSPLINPSQNSQASSSQNKSQ